MTGLRSTSLRLFFFLREKCPYDFWILESELKFFFVMR